MPEAWRGRSRRFRVSSSLLFASVFSAVGTAHAQTIASWLHPTSGLFNDPANWSTNPQVPINGSPAGASYDDVIAATGAPYTVSTGGVTVHSLTVNSPDATFQHSAGTLSATNGINLNLGTYSFIGGTLINTTIGGTGGTFIGAGTFNAITLTRPVTITGASTINNGMTLNAGIINVASGSIILFGNQALTGTGTIQGGALSVTGARASRRES